MGSSCRGSLCPILPSTAPGRSGTLPGRGRTLPQLSEFAKFLELCRHKQRQPFPDIKGETDTTKKRNDLMEDTKVLPDLGPEPWPPGPKHHEGFLDFLYFSETLSHIFPSVLYLSLKAEFPSGWHLPGDPLVKCCILYTFSGDT